MRAQGVPSVVRVMLVVGIGALAANPAAAQDGLDDLYNVPAPGTPRPGDGADGKEPEEASGDEETLPGRQEDDRGKDSDPEREGDPGEGEGRDDDRAQDDDDEDDPGLFGLYFPLTAYEELDPRAGEIQAYFFLGGLAPLGQVWLPILMSPDPSPDGYGLGALWLILAHLGPHALCAAALPCSLLFFAVPIVGPLVFLAAVLLNLANAGCFLANNFYFTPVALLNEYDRRVRAESGLSTAEGRSPDRRVEPIRY